MTRIEYTIQAQAWETNRTGGKVVGLKAEVPLKVLPWAPEEAPLCITNQDQTYYRLSMTKKLRTASSLLKPSVLTVVAAQPQAVMLSVDGSVASKSTIRLSLIFKPCSENTALPQLHAVKAKLQSLTFVSAAPMRSFPDLGTLNHGINPIIPFSLFDRLKLDGIEPLHWVLEHDSGMLVSREAAFDFDNNRQGGRINTPSPPSESFLATLGVPIDLSVLERRFLPPSFHSCLVCRAYVVRLDLYMGPMRTRISLRIPLQIAVEHVNDSLYDGCPHFEETRSQLQGQDVDLGLQVQAGRDLPQIPAEVNDLPEYAE